MVIDIGKTSQYNQQAVRNLVVILDHKVLISVLTISVLTVYTSEHWPFTKKVVNREMILYIHKPLKKLSHLAHTSF